MVVVVVREMGLVGVRCDCHRGIAVMISMMVVVVAAVTLHQTIWFWVQWRWW